MALLSIKIDFIFGYFDGLSITCSGLTPDFKRLAWSDPRNPVHSPPFYQVVLAAALYGSGQFEEAINVAKKALTKDKEYLDALLILASADVTLNHMEKAARIVGEIRRVKPDTTLEKLVDNQLHKNNKTLVQLFRTLGTTGLQQATNHHLFF